MPRRRSSLALASSVALLVGGLQANASAAVSAWQHVSAFSTNSSNKTLSTSCPAGKRVLSPGMFFNLTGPDHVILDDLRPTADLTGVTVQALEDEDREWQAIGSYGSAPGCAHPRPGSSGCPRPARSTPATRRSRSAAQARSGCLASGPTSMRAPARCCSMTCVPTPLSPPSRSRRSRTRPASRVLGASPPTPSARIRSRASSASRLRARSIRWEASSYSPSVPGQATHGPRR